MTTFYHDAAQPSWQGNYFPREAGPNGGPTWVTYTVSVTAAQAVSANKFYLVKLSRNTVVLDGSVTAAGLDVNSSTTALVDVGFVSDIAGDGDPADNADWFVDGAVLPTLTGAVTASFYATAADGFEVQPFVPADTATSDDAVNGGYFVYASLLGTVATAGVGTITVRLLIADKSGYSSTSELARA
jgi:hypothetical protein